MKKLITSDHDIRALIASEKRFLTKPKKAFDVNQSTTQRFSVFGHSDETQFDVFISCGKKMVQDFSIGLMFEKLLLYRVNGFHGATKSGFYVADHHAYPHSHMLTMQDIESGRGKNPSLHAHLSGEFFDIPTARLYFFKQCGIIGHEEYFDDRRQVSLFDLEVSDNNDADGSD